MPKTVSFQGKCRYVHYKNMKGDYDLEWSILQTQSVFLWTGKKEEVILRL